MTSFASVSVAALAVSLIGLVPASSLEAKQVPARFRGTVVASAPFMARVELGIALNPSSLSDTLGLSIASLTKGGPAELAGLPSDGFIQEINGISLRISAEDAADPLTAEAGLRRLRRVLATVKPGEDVSVTVMSGREKKEYRIPTRAPRNQISEARALVRSIVRRSPVAMTGLHVNSSDNARDTLGVFVNRVNRGSAAEKAGVQEGDRIAAINGVDLRVPAEDLADASAVRARMLRFQKAVEELEPGKNLTLRLYNSGRHREVHMQIDSMQSSELTNRAFQRPLSGRNMVAPNARGANQTVDRCVSLRQSSCANLPANERVLFPSFHDRPSLEAPPDRFVPFHS